MLRSGEDVNISLYGSNQRETEQSNNWTFYKWTRLTNKENATSEE